MNQEYLRSVINILRLDPDTFRVSFPYNFAFIELRGRKIEEIEGSSILMYICNTAHILPFWCYIHSIAYISELAKIGGSKN